MKTSIVRIPVARRNSIARNSIARSLLSGCPDDALTDHKKLAEMIQAGVPMCQVLATQEADRWPETYHYLAFFLPRQAKDD